LSRRFQPSGGYDPLGRLFQISSPGGPTTQFLYDGDELMADMIPPAR
jgi:YD repeat-containing protein